MMSTPKPTTINRQEAALPLVDCIKDALATADRDSDGHAQVLADISRLQLMVETPLETIYRIGHQVQDLVKELSWCTLIPSQQTWQNACVRIALELGIFDLLVAKGGDAVSVQELAWTCGADAVVLGQSSHTFQPPNRGLRCQETPAESNRRLAAVVR